MIKQSGIYEILNTVNGKRYIGQTINLYPRWSRHKHRLKKNTHPNAHLQNAWNKYGEKAFKFLPILTCQPSMLNFYEQQLLDKVKPEYNICVVAESCLGIKRGPQSPEHIEKKAAALRGKKRPPFSAEWLENMAAAQRGKQPGPRSEDTRKKIGEGNRGKKRTPTQSAAQSKNQKGRKTVPCSPEHKLNISRAKSGVPLSESHRLAISKAGIGRPWSEVRRAAHNLRKKV